MQHLQTLGERLKFIRRLKGMTQQQAADAIGCARNTISGWEGGSDTPGRESLIQLADIYEASIDWIEGRVHKINMPGICHLVDQPDMLLILALWDQMTLDDRTDFLKLAERFAPRRSDNG